MEQLTNPQNSYLVLLAVQAIHLIHHRLAKRHISFVECVAALTLIYQPSWQVLPPVVLVSVHYILVIVQIVGSLFISRLSPNWNES